MSMSDMPCQCMCSPHHPPISPSFKAACGWAGHCCGDSCRTYDDCDGDLTCKNGKCSGSGCTVAPPPSTGYKCSWAGHCCGDSCKTNNDCDGALTCNSGRCGGSGCGNAPAPPPVTGEQSASHSGVADNPHAATKCALAFMAAFKAVQASVAAIAGSSWHLPCLQPISCQSINPQRFKDQTLPLQLPLSSTVCLLLNTSTLQAVAPRSLATML